jgi:hypothetical protein
MQGTWSMASGKDMASAASSAAADLGIVQRQLVWDKRAAAFCNCGN